MDIIDKTLFYQIGDIKFWSGIIDTKSGISPEWPTRMIFRFSISAKACYEIICISTSINQKTLESNVFDPDAKYNLYYTDIAKWGDGVSRFNREIICEGKNLETCIKHAKADFEKMLKGDSDD